MIEKLKKLRAETNAPLAMIRKALDETGGDLAKARRQLSELSKEAVTKKAEREARGGVIEAFSHVGKIGVLVEVRCETDFVARNQSFEDFVHELALQIVGAAPKDVAQLLAQPYLKDETKTIADLLAETTAKLGEKIVVKRFVRYELGQ